MTADGPTIAVVGAGGQVGAALLASISADERVRIIGICRNEVSAGPLRLAGFDVRCGSVADPGMRVELLDGCDVIVNCTQGGGSPAQSRLAQESLVSSLCELTGSRRIVQFSSVAVYGRFIDSRLSSFESPRPNHPYGAEKRHMERFLLTRARRGGHGSIALRLGHVYGAGQGLSRSIIASATNPEFRLPFDGRRSSNAIHSRSVAAALLRLVLDWPGTGIYNLVDSPPSTWRDVFDWHTDAIGAPGARGLDDATSEATERHHRGIQATSVARQARRDVVSWARSAPGSLLASSPGLKAWASTVLAPIRSERLDAALQRKTRHAAIRVNLEREVPLVEARLVSHAVPGPQLPYEAARRAEDAVELGHWYARSSTPEAILHWNESRT